MWIERTPKGGYKYCERYTDPITNKQKKITKTFPKKTKGQDLIAYEYFRKEIAKRTEKFDNLTFNDLINMYMEDKKTELKATTFKSVKYTCLILSKTLGHIEIKNATAIQIKTMLKKSPTRQKTIFNQIIKWASTNKIIKDNELINIFKVHKKIKSKLNDTRLIDYNRYMVIYKDMTPNNDNYTYNEKITSYALIFMLNSGLRVGECVILNDDDIKDNTVIINKSYSKSIRMTTTTKNAESNRIIPLTNVLREIVERSRKLKELYDKKSSLLFPNLHLQPIINDCMIRLIRRVFEDDNFKTHNARHTYASLLIEKGVDFNIIARILGHVDTKMLYQTYGHITENRIKKDAEIIKNVMDNM